MCLLLLLQMTGTVAALVPNVSLLVESPRDSNCMTHSTRHIHYPPDFHSCPFRLVGDINVLEVSTLTDLSQPLTPRAPAASDMGITADLLPPPADSEASRLREEKQWQGFLSPFLLSIEHWYRSGFSRVTDRWVEQHREGVCRPGFSVRPWPVRGVVGAPGSTRCGCGPWPAAGEAGWPVLYVPG